MLKGPSLCLKFELSGIFENNHDFFLWPSFGVLAAHGPFGEDGANKLCWTPGPYLPGCELITKMIMTPTQSLWWYFWILCCLEILDIVGMFGDNMMVVCWCPINWGSYLPTLAHSVAVLRMNSGKDWEARKICEFQGRQSQIYITRINCVNCHTYTKLSIINCILRLFSIFVPSQSNLSKEVIAGILRFFLIFGLNCVNNDWSPIN